MTTPNNASLPVLPDREIDALLGGIHRAYEAAPTPEARLVNGRATVRAWLATMPTPASPPAGSVGGWVMVPRDFLRNVDEALQRHLDNHAPRQLPVHRADSDYLQLELRIYLGQMPAKAGEWALDVSGEAGHSAAHAFWNWWAMHGETHRHGYYESTWGAINAALRIAGVVPHIYAKPLPPEITKGSLGPSKEPPTEYGEIPPEFAQLGIFYGTNSLATLLREMDEHIRRLQEKLPPPRDTQPRKTRFA